MANKLTQFRLDETSLQRLQDIQIAKAHASGKEVAYRQYAPRRNGLTRADTIRLLIDEEWQRLQDSGALARSNRLRKQVCEHCGKSDCAGGYFCGY